MVINDLEAILIVPVVINKPKAVFIVALMAINDLEAELPVWILASMILKPYSQS
jgi:hypothetical protein